MSTIKTDAITAVSTNTDISVDGDGTGVPDLGAGMKVGGSVGIPVSELRTGTDGELITWDASGNPTTVAVGTSTHVLTSNGVGAAPTFQAAAGGMTEGSSQTLDGVSSREYTSLPSDLTTIFFNVDQAKSGTTDDIYLQIGDSGGYETTGYNSRVAMIPAGSGSGNSNGFILGDSLGNGVRTGGIAILSRVDSSSNLWAYNYNGAGMDGGNSDSSAAGTKALSAELDRIKIVQGSGTFSGGTVNISYM